MTTRESTKHPWTSGPARLAWIGIASVAIASCASADPTGALVKVSSQIPLGRIVIEVRNDDGSLAHCADFDVDRRGDGPAVVPTSEAAATAGRFPLPVTLALVPQEGATRRSFRVVVDGWTAPSADARCSSANRPVADIRAEAVSTYVEGAVVELPMPLTLSCFRAECDAGLTCRHGRCVSPSVGPETLERIAFGESDGTPCVALSSCTHVPLGPTPGEECTFDLPEGLTGDAFLPYVVYALPDTSERHVEFLDVADFDRVAGSRGPMLRLSPGLCAQFGANVVTDVGLSAPCPALDGRVLCPSSYEVEQDRVLEGIATRVPDGGTPDGASDATLPDAGTDGPADASLDRAADGERDGSSDGTLPDGGTGEGGTDSGSADGSDEGGDAAADGGVDGSGSGDSGTSGTCSATCCGRCPGGPTGPCVPDIGAVAIPTQPHAFALADDGTQMAFFRESSPGFHALIVFDTGTRDETVVEMSVGDPPLAVAVAGNVVVAATRPVNNIMSDFFLRFHLLPGKPGSGRPFFPLPGQGHVPLLASDGTFVYALYKDPGSGAQAPWIAQRIDPRDGSSPTATASLNAAVGATIGQPVAMAATRDSVVVAFHVAGGTPTLVHFDFSPMVPVVSFVTPPSADPVRGLTALRYPSARPEFAILQSNALRATIATWDPRLGGAPTERWPYLTEAAGLSYVDAPATGFRFVGFSSATQPSVFDVSDAIPAVLAAVEPSASTVLASARCAFWIGNATADPGILRGAPIPPLP